MESGAQVHAGCSAGGGVDMSENSQEQRIAQQLQFEVSCDGNSTARSLFVDSVKAEFGITRQFSACGVTIKQSTERNLYDGLEDHLLVHPD